MTTATATPFVIERIDLREPDTACTWKPESVEDAAAIFESEVGAWSWPYEEVLEELARVGHLGFTHVGEGFEVIARRVS